MRKLNLLNSIKKINRSVLDRKIKKNQKVINISRKYGYEYFDGDRMYGYGGYKYDGRWVSVAKRIKKIYKLKKNQIRFLFQVLQLICWIQLELEMHYWHTQLMVCWFQNLLCPQVFSVLLQQLAHVKVMVIYH